jgi:N-methylhydantoinase A
MASAARVHAVENGKDMVGRTLIAFGGAAPLHAARLAQKLGISRVVIPVGAGVGSAHGFLQAPISYEVVRSRLVALDAYDARFVESLFTEMRADAEGSRAARRSRRDACRKSARPTCATRGQGHEVRVPIAESVFGADGPEKLRLYFESVYRALYGRIIPKLEIEVVSWTLSLSEARGLPDARVGGRGASGVRRAEQAPSGRSWRGHEVEAGVHARDQLQPGGPCMGPQSSPRPRPRHSFRRVHRRAQRPRPRDHRKERPMSNTVWARSKARCCGNR